ncbi:unnamed protein product [Paramecium sonneborni]|uniref:Uncharacterized protein n=1 Tax=Paramecium sonneborni TaxID=65129 RepID=A0A8S1LER2_9CILI|nr:unnamed protein product [Paramecium sonneborni]
MQQFIDLCKLLISESTNQVQKELENLNQKEAQMLKEYQQNEEYDQDDPIISKNLNELIIHYRNYILHNYLQKLVNKILDSKEKIFQIRNNLNTLDYYLGSQIMTLEYIAKKLIKLQDLQTLKKIILNDQNLLIEEDQYQVSPIILDLFNLQIVRDIYFTQFNLKYGIEMNDYHRNQKKLEFDFDDENKFNQKNNHIWSIKITQPELVNDYPFSQDICQTLKNNQPSQKQSVVKETLKIQTQNQNDFIQTQPNYQQIQLSRSPTSLGNKNQFQSQFFRSPTSGQKKQFEFKIETQQNNFSIAEQILQRKDRQTAFQNKNDNRKKYIINYKNENSDQDIFDEQSFQILRNYLEGKYTQNKIDRTEDLKVLINKQRL